MPLSMGERIIGEMASVEVGAMVQNLGLAAEVMGLGGFVHYAHTDLGNAERTWFDELGFTMEEVPLSRLFGLPGPAGFALRRRGQDVRLRLPVGLEVGGRPVLRSHRPPWYPSMRAAVEAVVEHKLGDHGTYRGGIHAGRWSDPDRVAAQVPSVDVAALEATIALCEYVWGRYGRFPVGGAAFHTLLAFQVAHVDVAFYDRHYRTDAITDAHRGHHERWHTGRTPD